jgi:hypothetical protein
MSFYFLNDKYFRNVNRPFIILFSWPRKIQFRYFVVDKISFISRGTFFAVSFLKNCQLIECVMKGGCQNINPRA